MSVAVLTQGRFIADEIHQALHYFPPESQTKPLGSAQAQAMLSPGSGVLKTRDLLYQLPVHKTALSCCVEGLFVYNGRPK